MTRKIVVVGWGLAAHRFVTGLLADAADVDVTVYAGEGATAHDRDALPGALASGLDGADGVNSGAAALPTPTDPRLHLRAGVRATAVDRMHRLVHGTDHRVQQYDALVLATGANPVLPPIRGLRTDDGLLRGVYPAHTAADFRTLAAAAAQASRAVVIGGGAAGLRVAAALQAFGENKSLHVELVDQTPAIPEITPADSYYALRRAGVIAYQDCRVRSLEEGPNGALAAVTLADGFRLSTDLAVVTCGTAPNVALAWTAGLAVARGIVVDDTLRSVSDPAVYALGACAEHRRSLSGQSPTLLEQADVLADRLSNRDPLRTYRPAAAIARDVVTEAEAVLKAAAA